MQGGVFGGMAVKSTLWWGGGTAQRPYRPISGTRHWVPEEGAGKLGCGFSFLPSRTKIFQMNIFYSCRPISEKLKVT